MDVHEEEPPRKRRHSQLPEEEAQAGVAGDAAEEGPLCVMALLRALGHFAVQARPLAFSARGLNRRVNPFYRDCFVHASASHHQVRLQVWLPPGMWRHTTAEKEREEEGEGEEGVPMPSLLGIQQLHLSSLLGQQQPHLPSCVLQRELSRQRMQRLQLAEVQQGADVGG